MYTDFLYTHYLYNKNVHVYTWSYKYRTVEILEPILSIHSNSSCGTALFERPSFETWAKGTGVIRVGLCPEFDALEDRELVKSHRHNSEATGQDVTLTAMSVGWQQEHGQPFPKATTKAGPAKSQDGAAAAGHSPPCAARASRPWGAGPRAAPASGT